MASLPSPTPYLKRARRVGHDKNPRNARNRLACLTLEPPTRVSRMTDCMHREGRMAGGTSKNYRSASKTTKKYEQSKLRSEHIHYADQNKVYQSMITMLGMPFRFRSVTERTGRYTRKLAAERSPRAPSMQQPNFGNNSPLLE